MGKRHKNMQTLSFKFTHTQKDKVQKNEVNVHLKYDTILVLTSLE